jgi:hypothetical protein
MGNLVSRDTHRDGREKLFSFVENTLSLRKLGWSGDFEPYNEGIGGSGILVARKTGAQYA